MPWRSARARAHVQPDDLGFACLWSTLLRHSWQNTLMISLPCLGFLLLCLCFSAVPDMFGFLFNSYCIDPKCIGAWIFRTILCNTFSTNFHRWAWHFDIPLVVFFSIQFRYHLMTKLVEASSSSLSDFPQIVKICVVWFYIPPFPDQWWHW